MKIRVTSTAFNAGEFASRCVKSVIAQTHTDWSLDFFDAASTDTTSAHVSLGILAAPDKIRLHRNDPAKRESVFGNLLPLWRSFDDDDIIVWLDGDDRLAVDRALEMIWDMHAVHGAMITYGQFVWDDGLIGTAHQLPDVTRSPRAQAWGASHLKTFRAGLVKRIRDEDLRGADGEYSRFCTDMNVMFPIMEMAPEHAIFCPKILHVYNSRINHVAQHPEDVALERVEVARLRAIPSYSQVFFKNKSQMKRESVMKEASLKTEPSAPITLPPSPPPVALAPQSRVVPSISSTGYWTGESIHLAHCMSRPLAKWLCTFFAGQEDQLIYDLGCGVGAYLNELRKRDFRSLIGVEGQRPSHALLAKEHYIERDLTQPLSTKDQPYRGALGHVITLEVAEHIPAIHEKQFLDNVETLTRPGGLLVMSWAVVGQGGDGHVNCRSNDYAIAEVEKRGFVHFEQATKSARAVISDVYNEQTGDLPWFKNTLLIFKRAAE